MSRLARTILHARGTSARDRFVIGFEFGSVRSVILAGPPVDNRTRDVDVRGERDATHVSEIDVAREIVTIYDAAVAMRTSGDRNLYFARAK